jgi:hypothetical protein
MEFIATDGLMCAFILILLAPADNALSGYSPFPSESHILSIFGEQLMRPPLPWSSSNRFSFCYAALLCKQGAVHACQLCSN